MADDVTEKFFPTGNLSRDGVILQAIADAGNGATLEEIYEHVPTHIRPSFGELLPEEVSEAKQWVVAQAQHDDAPVEPNVQVENDVQVEPVERSISRQECLDQIASLTRAIGRERGELVRLQTLHADARRKLSDSIMRWQQRRGAVSFESLIRAEIRANQQLKQDVKDGKVAPRRSGRVLRSAVDAMCAATAETGQRAGGGFAFKRAVRGPDGRLMRGPDGSIAVPMARGAAARAMRRRVPSER